MSSRNTEAEGWAGMRRRRLIFAAKLAVTVIAFVAVAMLADVSEAVTLLRSQNMLLLGMAGAVILLQITLGAFRWRAVLIASVQQEAAQISPAEAFRLYYASVFFNAVLPGGSLGGDVVRAVSTRALGVTTSAAIHSVVLDRVLTLCALLFLAMPAFPLIWQSVGVSSTLFAVAGGGCAIVIVGWLVVSRVEQFVGLRTRVAAFIAEFVKSARELNRRPSMLVLALVLATAAHIAGCVAAWLLAASIGINLGLGDALALMPLVFLASAIPISVGGWGVREVGAIGLLGLVGISSHEAMLVSLQLGVVSTIVSLPGGLIWLARNAGRKSLASAGDPMPLNEPAGKR